MFIKLLIIGWLLAQLTVTNWGMPTGCSGVTVMFGSWAAVYSNLPLETGKAFESCGNWHWQVWDTAQVAG